MSSSTLSTHAADPITADTVAKFLHESNDVILHAGQLVVVDEAGMTGTLALDELRARAQAAGAKLLLVGDPGQLAAVEAGGALRLLEHELAAAGGGARLAELHRFRIDWEPAATLRLRDGDTGVLDVYAGAGRIRGGSRTAMTEAAYAAWQADLAAGKTSLLVASKNDSVLEFNRRARADRVAAGQVDDTTVVIDRDESRIGVGDQVVTRANDRKLQARGGQDFVRNGDIWTVEKLKNDGSLSVRSARHEGVVVLPAAYVREHLQLGYASTVHRAQGATVDTCHALVGADQTRESLYVAATRGRERNTVYAVTEEIVDVDRDHKDTPGRAAHDVLAGVLGRTTEQVSATETLREALEEGSSVRTLLPQYRHVAQVDAGAATLDAALAGIPPGLAERIANDPARAELERALLRATATAADADRVSDTPARLLHEAVSSRELGSAESVATVLAHRLDIAHPLTPAATMNTGELTPSELLLGPGFVRQAETQLRDPQTAAYLRDVRELVAERVEQLGVTALNGGGADSARARSLLGQPPAAPGERAEWVRGAGLVAAWQERHGDANGRADGLAAPRGSADREAHAAVTTEVGRIAAGSAAARERAATAGSETSRERLRELRSNRQVTGPGIAGGSDAARQAAQQARHHQARQAAERAEGEGGRQL